MVYSKINLERQKHTKLATYTDLYIKIVYGKGRILNESVNINV